MVALIYLSCAKPALKRLKTAQRGTHPNYLEPVRLVEYALHRFELGNYCLKQVTALLILHQVKLIYDEVLDVKVKLLFYHLVQQSIRFLNCAYCQVDVR